MQQKRDYVLGHGDAEMQRLRLQASILEPVTRRLIRECGIMPGMRVLEVGCGAGDVTMLLAAAVGPDGRVTAIDRADTAIAAARARAAERGFSNITFALADESSLPAGAPFDAAFGRYVQIHQPDPAAMLRRLAAAVRPGGILAFHELSFAPHHHAEAAPPSALLEAMAESVTRSFRATLPSPDFAMNLYRCFAQAGLGMPEVIWESVVTPHDPPIPEWHYLTYMVMLPHMEALGLVPPQTGDPQTLLPRLRAELAATGAQLISRPQVCVWLRTAAQ